MTYILITIQVFFFKYARDNSSYVRNTFGYKEQYLIDMEQVSGL